MSDTPTTPPQSAVIVSLKDLEAGSISSPTLEEAFGPNSLGILVVRDLPPRFVDLRRQLLSYAARLGNLPAHELEKLECPAAKWLVGWSRGRETLRPGVYDTLKGSYYVNCAFYKDPSLSGAQGNYPSFPEYTASNIWPADTVLPGFRRTFEELCALIIDTAVLVARACDRYAGLAIEGYRAGCLEEMVRESTTTKARLLHYFPPEAPAEKGSAPVGEEVVAEDDWCTTHIDHGCLTGLTSAMFIDELACPPTLPFDQGVAADGGMPPPLVELPSSPDPTAGLYIHSRRGTTAKVNIPKDCLAFQTGEALEVITRGKFRAVPHFVRGAKGEAGRGVSRNTLAVFTQPNLYDMVDEKRDFAAFAREIVTRNH